MIRHPCPRTPSFAPSSGSSTTPAPSTPAPSGTQITGVVADGYVSGARIYVDVNGDGKPDGAEDTGEVTDSTGHFSVTTSLQGPLIAVGGTNIDTGLPSCNAFCVYEFPNHGPGAQGYTNDVLQGLAGGAGSIGASWESRCCPT